MARDSVRRTSATSARAPLHGPPLPFGRKTLALSQTPGPRAASPSASQRRGPPSTMARVITRSHSVRHAAVRRFDLGPLECAGRQTHAPARAENSPTGHGGGLVDWAGPRHRVAATTPTSPRVTRSPSGYDTTADRALDRRRRQPRAPRTKAAPGSRHRRETLLGRNKKAGTSADMTSPTSLPTATSKNTFRSSTLNRSMSDEPAPTGTPRSRRSSRGQRGSTRSPSRSGARWNDEHVTTTDPPSGRSAGKIFPGRPLRQ